MMEEQAILCLGALTLIGSGTELVRLHRGNPLLRGLRLMGQAILVGGMAAAFLFMAVRWFPSLQPWGTFLVLVAFCVCGTAFSELAHLRQDLHPLTKTLLAIQAVAALGEEFGFLSSQFAIVLLSLSLVAETLLIERIVSKGFSLAGQSSAHFVAGLLRFLVALNLVRAGAAADGLLRGAQVGYWTETATYAIFIACGVGLGFGFFSMTTSNLMNEFEKLASTDPLTQVCNRRAFLERCATEQERSRREGIKFSMLLLDLDHFKQFNDTFGHQAGDEALRACVERIQNAVRGVDTICRWGGEEFAVLLPNASSQAAQIVAERIRLSFQELHRPGVPATSWRSQDLTVTIGTATWNDTEESSEHLLGRADQALYRAKDTGRNRTLAHEELQAL